jgi:hypothetical protein
MAGRACSALRRLNHRSGREHRIDYGKDVNWLTSCSQRDAALPRLVSSRRSAPCGTVRPAQKPRRIEMASWKAAIVFVAVAVLVIGVGSAAAAESRRVAFFGFFLINTSLQPTQPAEEKRLEMLDTILRDQLAGAGRFSFVAISPELQKQAIAGSGLPNCNGCERDLAEKTDAEWVAWGTVQKVSNLILNINLYMEDVQTGRIEFAHSV